MPDKQRIEIAGPTTVGDAVASARRYAIDQELGARDQARLCIIVEELVTNLIEHGGAEHTIGIEYARLASSVALAIEDGGEPFDPRTALDDEVPARGGGAGLRLVKSWSEVVGYQSTAGRNRLELMVPLTDA